MMESLGSLLSILHARKGHELRLEAGQKARLLTATGIFDLSQDILTPADISSVMMPIMPNNVRPQLATQPEVNFTYSVSGLGSFGVRLRRGMTGIAVSFMLTGANVAAPQPVAQNGTHPAPRPTPTATPIPTSQTTSQPAQQPVRPITKPLASSTNNGHGVSLPATPPRAAMALTIDRLFHDMVANGASDLHISTGMPPLIRKDGLIKQLDESLGAMDAEAVKQLLTPIMPQKNREEFERRNDTDFAYEIAALARFRANIFRDRKGMGGVFRVIPNEILTTEKLGLSPHILNLCKLNKGLVLVTGPTGSGKSTTLCALIDYINRNREDHIITIEDPIEFVHENKKCLINQREVHNHTDSFKDALRAALREDPDIVLVGEMRDLETVAIAIETAETGHLVFGTLHTTTAASTVDRIIDQFPPDRQMQIRIMLSESLRGVISQTLLRKIGGGRVAALEVLIINAAMSNLIREGKTFQIPSMMQTGRGNGNVLLNDALLELVKNKIVAPDEAYAKSVDKKGLEDLLKRNNIGMNLVSNPA